MSCFRFLGSNTYCVVFLLCFSFSWVYYVASVSGLSIFDCPLCVLLTFIYIHVYFGVQMNTVYD